MKWADTLQRCIVNADDRVWKDPTSQHRGMVYKSASMHQHSTFNPCLLKWHLFSRKPENLSSCVLFPTLPTDINLGLPLASSAHCFYSYYSMHHPLPSSLAICVGLCHSCLPLGKPWASWGQGPWFASLSFCFITEHLNEYRPQNRGMSDR